VNEISATSPEDLARMLAIPDELIDTSEIPEQTGQRKPLKRDSSGRLPRHRSPIRDSIAAVMTERDMTAYALWKAAREHCPTLSETAVGEFLKGNRSVGLDYLEAIMAALDLTIVPAHR
jgi:hypothetical protein